MCGRWRSEFWRGPGYSPYKTPRSGRASLIGQVSSQYGDGFNIGGATWAGGALIG